MDGLVRISVGIESIDDIIADIEQALIRMITIAEKQLREIREHGIRDYPYECCGLLLVVLDPKESWLQKLIRSRTRAKRAQNGIAF